MAVSFLCASHFLIIELDEGSVFKPASCRELVLFIFLNNMVLWETF